MTAVVFGEGCFCGFGKLMVVGQAEHEKRLVTLITARVSNPTLVEF